MNKVKKTAVQAVVFVPKPVHHNVFGLCAQRMPLGALYLSQNNKEAADATDVEGGDRGDAGGLDNTAGIHDADIFTHFRHHRNIMGDKNQAHVHGLLNFFDLF